MTDREPDLSEETEPRAPRRSRRDAPQGRGAKRRRRGGRGTPAEESSTSGDRRARRSTGSTGPVNQVSQISASALRRVTVLGDRPSQVVFSLAEQSTRKRGTYLLAGLLGLSGIALLTLLAVLALQLFSPSQLGGSAMQSQAAPPEGHSQLLPKLYHHQEQLDIFDPIAERTDETKPLTEKGVFGGTEELELEEFKLNLTAAEVTDACTATAWGEQLTQSLTKAECTGAARGVYHGDDSAYVGQYTLFDLRDADAADAVAENLAPEQSDSGFVLPLSAGLKGEAGLRSGYSQATSQVMGHYLAVFWVARSDGETPDDNESMASLNVALMDSAVGVYERVRDAE